MKLRITQVIDSTITTERIAMSVPYACMLNMVVVMVPGPTSNDMAIGTAPMLSGDSFFSWLLPEIKILIEIISNRMPPTTSKL